MTIDVARETAGKPVPRATPLRVGSMFSGYGGLELGIARALDAEVAWHAEIMPAANRVLAARFPGVPNLGDVSAVDYSTVTPVDVIAAGFPCQDVSNSGLRRGLRPGTRSGLWSEVVRAVDALRPRFVIVENVRGLTSAQAHRPMESDEVALGDGSVRPALRALGAVLGDLADLGFDAEWIGVRAADVGAPHSRFRIFLLATPADPGGEVRQQRPRLRTVEQTGEWWRRLDDRDRPDAPDADGAGHERGADLVRRRESDAPGRVRRDLGRRSGEAREVGASAAAARGEGAPEPAPDAERSAPERLGERGGVAGEVRLPRDADGPAADEGRDAARDPREDPRRDWGPYGRVIARWERRLGRVAPPPTRGGRLDGAFVEWMMGLPAGWVTDPDLGLLRSDHLRLLGNGVVPQQAEQALRLLVARAR